MRVSLRLNNFVVPRYQLSGNVQNRVSNPAPNVVNSTKSLNFTGFREWLNDHNGERARFRGDYTQWIWNDLYKSGVDLESEKSIKGYFSKNFKRVMTMDVTPHKAFKKKHGNTVGSDDKRSVWVEIGKNGGERGKRVYQAFCKTLIAKYPKPTDDFLEINGFPLNSFAEAERAIPGGSFWFRGYDEKEAAEAGVKFEQPVPKGPIEAHLEHWANMNQ